jgi:hypothetical protein
MYYYPSLIAIILSSFNPHDSILLTTLLVLFLVGVEPLGWLDAQGRLDTCKRGDAEEDDRDKHEESEK